MTMPSDLLDAPVDDDHDHHEDDEEKKEDDKDCCMSLSHPFCQFRLYHCSHSQISTNHQIRE